MFFSIVVPVYNVESYIRECIESVLNQTYPDFELILVNDGSTDQSPTICEEYAAKDSRVKVIHKENGGLSDARNVGTAQAIGEYIIYIDSDDYIQIPTFLEQLRQTSEAKPDIIVYKFIKYFEESKSFSSRHYSMSGFENCNDLADQISFLVQSDGFYCSAWSKAIRLDLLKEHNINFEKGLLGEDQEWYYHILLKAKSMAAIDSEFLVYRQRPNSITSSWKMKNLTDCIYVIEKWKQTIAKEELPEKYRTALFHSLAKLYCNLLIGYVNFQNSEKKIHLSRIQAMCNLLHYHLNPRTAVFYRVYRLLGFKGMLLCLNILCKVR